MNDMPEDQIIAFVGGGNMARSIIGGMIAAGWDAENIKVADPMPEQRDYITGQFGVQCFKSNDECILGAGIVVIAVKPQKLKSALQPIGAALIQSKPLVISIAAGIRMATIAGWIGGEVPMIRVMPNTPALVNCGISGMIAGADVDETLRDCAARIMSSVGPVVWVTDEKDIDTVTGISGSGPAYYFKLMEIMIDAAISNGLGSESARKLVLHTALGAAQLAITSDHPPAELRRQVTSPGGTTEAALLTMEGKGIDGAVTDGIQAAIRRSDELATTLAEE